MIRLPWPPRRFCAALAARRRGPPPMPPPYEPQVQLMRALPPRTQEEALPGGFADDDFGFHYVEPEVADAPLARRRETSEAMTLQSKISSARSVGVVLDLVTSHDDLDALHVATALHRLARLGGRGLAASAAVAALLKRLEDGADGAVESLGAQAQVSLLWAAARLTLGGPWLSRLTKALEVSDLSGHQLATAFYSVARLESSTGFPPQEFQDLVEQLHRELQRRQKALGPGGTSALDTILLADALAKLQIRDEPLFSSLAAALLKHLELKQLGVRELRHAASAFGQMGFVDKQLMAKMMAWLQTRLDDCSSNDLSALAFSFSRCVPAVPSGRAFFAALPPQLTGRLQRGEVLPQEAAVFLVSFSQAHLLDEHVESLMRLAPLIEKSPNTLNGHWMALLVPSISHFAKASLMEVLANRSSQLSATLSPRQLARLAIGFGQGQLQSPKLWQSLTKEAMSKSGSFSAPDTLRLLAGLDAANVNDRKLLKIFWARVAEKQAKYLAEELLALLQLWPRVPPDLRSEELPRDLMKHLRSRLEKGTKGLGWLCPGELGVELLEWLPSSRHLTGRPLDLRLLRAMLLQLPRQLRSSGPETRQRLLSALTTEPELWSKARSELLADEKFHRALGKICQELRSDEDRDSAVEVVFSCAQLGVDSRELQNLLQGLSQEPLPLAQSAKVCWACAELGVHQKEAASLLGKQVAERASDPEDTQSTDGLSWLRLSWASLALDGDPQRPLEKVKDLPGEVLMQQMSPCDLRPLQQLAWHSQQHLGLSGAWSDAVLGAGPLVPRTARAAGTTMPSQTDAEKLLSSLLQNLRVPHVVASSKAVPGNIYRVPLWFPDANAVLDLSTSSDRLISGKYSGTARMRRRQLQEAGLRVHDFDVAVLRGAASHVAQLCAVAEAIASSCPEARAWLDSEIPQAMQTPPLLSSDDATTAESVQNKSLCTALVAKSKPLT